MTETRQKIQIITQPVRTLILINPDFEILAMKIAAKQN